MPAVALPRRWIGSVSDICEAKAVAVETMSVKPAISCYYVLENAGGVLKSDVGEDKPGKGPGR